MIVFLLFIVVLLIGLTTAAVMGKIGGFMADPISSHAFTGIPAGQLALDDLADLRFDHGLRGYRMDQVDQVVDALCARVRELESEVASLAAGPSAPTAPASPAGQPESRHVLIDPRE